MKGSAIATVVAIILFIGVIGVSIVGAIFDGITIWDVGVVGLAALGILVVAVAWIVALWRS